MRHALLLRSTLTPLVGVTASASAQAAGLDLPPAASYLTAGSLALTLVALAGLLISNRSLRRELDRHGVERARAQSSRVRIEQGLRSLCDELERETQAKHAELGDVQRQLDVARVQLEAAEIRIQRVARIDEITGTANRLRFDEALDQEIKRTIRDKEPMSLLMCEIDRFAEYASRRDEERSDETLAKVARAVCGVFQRAGDLVARYEAAKLAVILPATDAETAARFGERVRKRVWELCVPHEAAVAGERMTVSAGVATLLPSRLHRGQELVAAAEGALAQAREAGRNRVATSLLS